MKENVKKQVVNFIKVFTVFTIFVSLIVSLGVPKSAIEFGGGGTITVCPLPYGVNVKYVDTDGVEIDTNLNTYQRVLYEKDTNGAEVTFEQKNIENYVYKGYYYNNLAGTIAVGSQTNLVTASTSVVLNGKYSTSNSDLDPIQPEVEDCLTDQTFVSLTYNVFMVYEAVAVDKYTVTYDANGGTGTVTDTTQYDANTDATIKASTGMTKTGFEFEAWNTAADGSGTTYAPNATLTMTSNVTLFAQWKAAVEKYTVTYDANGGTGTVTDATQYDANTDATIKASTGLTKTGFEFESWNTAADGSGTTYAPNATLTMTSNVTLFAQWKAVVGAVEQYTITYDANGGTGTVTDATQYDANTDAIVKASTGLTKTGFEFVSWNTVADGTGTTYAADGVITMTGNITLFAQWKAVPVTPEPITPTTPTTPTKLPQTGDNSAIYLMELLLGLGVLIGSKVVIGKKF